MRNHVLILSALAMLIAATGCQDADSNDPKVQEVMEYAPPDAFGVIHVDLVPLRKCIKELGAGFEYPAFQLGVSEGYDLDVKERLIRLVNLADSLDYFLTEQKGNWQRLLVLRSSSKPDDWQEDVLWAIPRHSSLEKLRNGRYKVLSKYGDQPDTGLRMIFGSLADDVDDNIILIGQEELLTDRFIARPGKGKNELIHKLLTEVDTSTEVWGGADFESGLDKDSAKLWTVKTLYKRAYSPDSQIFGLPERYPDQEAPLKIVGNLNLTVSGGMLTMHFANEGSSNAMKKCMYTQPVLPIGMHFTFEWFDPNDAAVETVGQKLTITFRGMKEVLQTYCDAYGRAATDARQEANRAVSKSNLRGIGTAAYLYRHVNNGQSPPSLEKLVEEFLIQPKGFISPMSGRYFDELILNENGVPIEPSDYVYVVLPKTVPGTFIQAYEKPENYKKSKWGEGTLVLFPGADVRVEWMNIKDFREALAKTEQWLAENQESGGEGE